MLVMKSCSPRRLETKSVSSITSARAWDGVLYRKWESDDGSSCRWQLILPKHRIQEVLRETHDSASGGHFGVMKALSKTRERFYWDRLRDDVEKWCRECHACGARKGPKTRTKGRLQRYNVGTTFERMALDILGPLPVTTKGNRYLLVLMDYFTKWPEAIPITDQEASTVAEELVRARISRYGVPMILHSDRGTNFNSALFTELCKLFGILKTRTTALHPESDGMVESTLDWKHVVSDAVDPIKGKFNPLTASWWGCWWESLIYILKNLLRSGLGGACLTYEEMTTVLCDCGTIIYSQPISYVTDNEAELVPLSPSMFLHDIKAIGVPDYDAIWRDGVTRLMKLQTARCELDRFNDSILSRYPLEDPVIDGEILLTKTVGQRSEMNPSGAVRNEDAPNSKTKKTRSGFVIKIPQKVDL
ncbi:Retrovirus-related Pol polyprotein from transposon 412 [Araneus ventricosus]|uniref:RNA-directed DNA polymerase n=1 Tax=Araneus ventricosus TaxID=182803 RepID=A0A4Y2JLT7_ARAVE|nr:Retrovirus-related Pol polyprotein from transposon 412 [Araneus ventricosus]